MSRTRLFQWIGRRHRRRQGMPLSGIEQCEQRLVLSASAIAAYGSSAAESAPPVEVSAEYIEAIYAAIDAGEVVLSDAGDSAAESATSLEPSDADAGLTALAASDPASSDTAGMDGEAEDQSNVVEIISIDVQVTSSGIELRGQIYRLGDRSGFTITFTGAISGTATTDSNGAFVFTFYGSASGLVDASAAGYGLESSNSFPVFV